MHWKQKIHEKRFYYLIGLAGIHASEKKITRRVGSVFSGLMVGVAILLLLEWQWQLLLDITLRTSFYMNLAIFCFFVVTFVVELSLVCNRQLYFAQNWALPIIIVLGIPVLFEYQPLSVMLDALRPLLALYVLFPSLKTLINFFFDGNLRTTILGAGVVIVIFGILVAGVDPNVKNVWDGIWWAIATVATIGYGDVVPSSALGRLLGIILVVLGVAIFVIITANILAFTLKKDTHRIKQEEKDIKELLKEIKQMKETQVTQTRLLKRLSEHLRRRDD